MRLMRVTAVELMDRVMFHQSMIRMHAYSWFLLSFFDRRISAFIFDNAALLNYSNI